MAELNQHDEIAGGVGPWRILCRDERNGFS